MRASATLPLDGTNRIAYRLVVVCDMEIAAAGLFGVLQRQQDFPCLGQLAKSEDAMDVVSSLCPHLVVVYTYDSLDACADLCQEIRAKHSGSSVLVIIDGAAQAAKYCPARGVSRYLPHWTSTHQIVERIHQILESQPLAAATAGGGTAGENRSSIGPQEPNQPAIRRLTAKQQSVLRLLLQGQSNAEIARALSLSVAAVKWHLHAIYPVLGVHSRTEAVASLIRKELDKAPQ